LAPQIHPSVLILDTMAPRKVLIVGAGGKAGLITLKKMAQQPELFAASGSARSKTSAATVEKETGAGCIVCDVTSTDSIDKALSGVETLVVLSSATPKPNFLKMLGFLCQKYCCCNKEAKMGSAFQYPTMPEQVDWQGGQNLIDAAKRVGVPHIIYVGSMGGTKPDHFLNKMGNGNILLWKRKAEMYLLSSGIPYTIIHPGGLLPHFGSKVVPGGKRELLVGVDDVMMDNPAKSRCIPREDLAEVVMQCALHPEAAVGRSFDLSSHDPSIEGTTVWDKDLPSLLKGLEGKNCDYELPKHPILGN